MKMKIQTILFFIIGILCVSVRSRSDPLLSSTTPVFSLFNISEMQRSNIDFVDEGLDVKSTVDADNDSIELLTHATNVASRDFGSDVWIIVVLCIVLCFALRHANDFYAGSTITLVEEGIWRGRFKHREEEMHLSHVERDFSMMYEKLAMAGKKFCDETEDERLIDTDR